MSEKVRIVVSDNGRVRLMGSAAKFDDWEELYDTKWDPIEEFRKVSGGSVSIRKKSPLTFGFTPTVNKHNHPHHPEERSYLEDEGLRTALGIKSNTTLHVALHEKLDTLFLREDGNATKAKYDEYVAMVGPMPKVGQHAEGAKEKAHWLAQFLLEIVPDQDFDPSSDRRRQESEPGHKFQRAMKTTIFEIE